MQSKRISTRTRALILAAAVLTLTVGVGAFVALGPSLLVAAAAGGATILFGVNTVTYEWPVAGTTAPTATQSRTHQTVSAIITGDGAATTFTVTHNWGLSTAELAAGFPWVNDEQLLAAGYTAAQLITSKTTNAVAFSNTAFTGAGLRITLFRPWTPTR